MLASGRFPGGEMRAVGLKLLVISSLILVAACSGRRSHTAAEPTNAVRTRLIAIPDQANVFPVAMQAAGTSYWQESSGNPLVWRFAMNGAPYCAFFAELKEQGPAKTQVITWTEPADDAAKASVAAGHDRADYSFLCNVAGIAGEETVSAVVENRAADKKVILSKLRQNLVADPASAMRAADAAMQAAAPKSIDPCDEDIASKRCEDWRTFQQVRAQQRKEEAEEKARAAAQ
jgi:hypothetical protein